MESLASVVEAWWPEVPAPATGREDWDAETKSRCAGRAILPHRGPLLSKFTGNIADENVMVAVETF